MPLIYVIDDEDLMRDSLLETFSRDGFTARGFGSARPALEQLAAQTPDVVLCDLKLPGLDGLNLFSNYARVWL